jgi:cell wall-associated NlpC family hydrolase
VPLELIIPTVLRQTAIEGSDVLKRRLHVFGIGVTVLTLVSITGAVAADVHTVKKGDTLWSIARKAGVSVDDIKRANGVSENKPLQLGMKLNIPSKNESKKKQKIAKQESQPNRKAIIRFGSRMASKLQEQADEAEKKSDDKDSDIVRTALAYRGSRYVRGGTGRKGFDCSGFTRHIYSKYGVNLPHSSSAQANCGTSVAKSELKPGDLVFFQTRRRAVSHVGMYIGDGKFIHASTPRSGVLISSLSQPYYAARYKGARRLNQSE